MPPVTCASLPAGVDLATAAAWPRCGQAAKLLGLSVKTLRRRVLAGRLAAYAVAGVTRFDPADLAAGVRAVGPAPAPPLVTGSAADRALERFFGRTKARAV